MDIKAYLNEAYDYTYWANRRYFAVAEGLSEEQLHRLLGHSWGDVHGTLVHMMSSEWVWMERWHGRFPKSHLEKAQFPTLEALKKRWGEVEAELRGYLDAQTDETLQAPLTYINFKGESFHVPLWQMMAHIANHETHHRGELAAMFALMEVPHPEDEMIQYFLNVSGQKRF